jgi:hypothetical protein
MPIFVALDRVRSSGGEYLNIRAWEIQIMIEMGGDAEKYGKLTVRQRARFICARQLPAWFETLQMDAIRKK